MSEDLMPRVPEQRLPIAPESERGVLGSVLVDPTLFRLIQGIVQDRHFHNANLARVYRAMEAVADDHGGQPDYQAVVEELRARKQLELIDGESFLMGLVSSAVSGVTIEYHAQLVRDRSASRDILRAAQSIMEAGLGGTYTEAGEYQGYAEGVMIEAFSASARGELMGMSEILSEAKNKLEALCKSDRSISGISTGFRELDDLTLGLNGGELIVMAARPAMGKSALALNVAAAAAAQQKKGVLLFSLEMSAEQLGTRLLAQEARVSLTSLRHGEMVTDDWDKIYEAMRHLKDAPLQLETATGVSIVEIRSRARMQNKLGMCDLVIVDYMQLVQPRPGIQSREQQVADISRGLKQLALELNIPVIALSQLNRAVDSRKPPRPQMSDLRESGAIEQDADVIIFINREERYDPDTPRKGLADLIVAKQRNGPTGTIEVRYTDYCTRFDNVEPGPRPGDFGATIGFAGRAAHDLASPPSALVAEAEDDPSYM